ncbi:phage major capsid protein [Mesorhizobium dulcispinae]|uniref:phage major capsid protein n=1 Tax=Mesorhizobium dulcispinae TaxID=3072316 RepID=UPI002A23BEB9|nr:phage major capsid protein [Mesorhizobium sp. VK23D]MDX8517963.1 phage major capsid protein [Mesorhizobium sp. VK23D]
MTFHSTNFPILETKNAADDVDPIIEVKTALDALTADVNKKTAGVDKITERLDGIEAKLARPNIQTKKDDEPSAETKAFADYLRMADRAPELKTLTVSSDPQGGYLAPAEMSAEFIRNLVEFSPIRAIASVRTTGNASVLYPKRNTVTNASWRGETQAQTASEPTFGQHEVVIREVNTYVDISNALLADSAGQAEAEVRLALAEDFGQKEGAAFVNGTGVLDPEGLMTNPDIGETVSGGASTLTADGLINAMYAIPAAYRNAGTWLMNGTSLAAVRKMKDSVTGAYIWQPALALGQPETLLGRPVVEAVDMDDVGAGNYPVLFGDFSGYRIVDRLALSILVNPYVQATNGITRIHATRRVGGGVIQPAKFRKIKVAAS